MFIITFDLKVSISSFAVLLHTACEWEGFCRLSIDFEMTDLNDRIRRASPISSTMISIVVGTFPCWFWAGARTICAIALWT